MNKGKMENVEETAGTICNYERRFFILVGFFFFFFCNLKTVAGGSKQSSSYVVNHCHVAFAVEDVFIQKQLSKSETQTCS